MRHTYIINRENETLVRFYSTIIVRFNCTGIILNAGDGPITRTTIQRMNWVSEKYGLGYQVFRKKFKYWIKYGDYTFPYSNECLLRRNLKQ